MAKRRADVELNQDNWDDDHPIVNETESCEQVDNATLATRKILVPKSRRPNNTAGLFKSMPGFAATSSAFPSFIFNSKPTVSIPSNFLPSVSSSTPEISQEADYLKELQTLNRNLLDWIEKHVKSDPHCILSPVFTDYEKHLQQLHKKYPNVTTSDSILKSVQSNSFASTTSVNDSVNKELVTVPPTVSRSQTIPVGSSNGNDVVKPTFSFSLPPLSSSTSFPPLFKFGTSLPSTSPFAAQPIPADPSASKEEDEDTEEYQPPKPEVREIKEEGSVYTVRCKLFYKTETEWRERGVGNLFIKPQSENKFQLLVRADTNLGNILLNVMITKEIPVKVQKNNVTLVCVASPPLPNVKSTKDGDSPKPSLVLLRLKTEEAANDLLKQIDRHRGLTTEN